MREDVHPSACAQRHIKPTHQLIHANCLNSCALSSCNTPHTTPRRGSSTVNNDDDDDDDDDDSSNNNSNNEQATLTAMSTSGFPRFPDLPTELRLEIWSFCLPGRRVFELDSPLTDYHVVFPAGGGAYPRNLSWPRRGQTPVISHVCREAREVAFKCHACVTGEKGQTDDHGVPYPPWREWSTTVPTWFRKGFDVVHLNWTECYGYHSTAWVRTCPLPSFQWLANQSAAASVTAELLLPFDPNCEDPDLRATMAYQQTKYFSPHVLYYVVLATVEMHMSDDEATQVGVFGAFGEEPIQLVDPRDTATVARFRGAWRGRQSPLEEPDVAKFFSQTVDAADVYRGDVEKWRQDLDDVWLARRAIESGLERDARNQIFLGDWLRQKADKEHPWVQKQLALMPRFEPALMFRHCNDRCSWSRHARSRQTHVE